MLNSEILKNRQKLNLNDKINLSKERIIEWYEAFDGDVYVAFSGGLDSTVLAHMVRSIYPNVKLVFSNTGLEFPEIKKFVKTFKNVDIVKPEIPFHKVIEKYGYPVISKDISYKISMLQNPTIKNKNSRRLYLTGVKSNGEVNNNFKLPEKWKFLIDAPFKISDKCCKFLKKDPLKNYEKENSRYPIIGTMASESNRRVIDYYKTGCNSFDGAQISSKPLSFWLKEDINKYIKKYNLPYCSIYDKGWDRTGCIFCMFGVHMEKNKNRFQKLKETHPEKWRYCIYTLGLKNVLDQIGISYE